MGPICLHFQKSDPLCAGVKVQLGDQDDELPVSHGSIRVTRQNVSQVRIDIPLTSTEQLYYRRDESGLTISSDLRRLYRPSDSIDPKAIYALLQFGAIVPPQSPWLGISRLVPGGRFAVNCETTDIQRIVSHVFAGTDSDQDLVAELRQSLAEMLDRILIESCPNENPIILFSGGVDSGVLAGRAAALGWRKTTLINYCLGPDDSESALAARMAERLGLEFQRVEASRAVDRDLLAELAGAYRSPFGDYSALPTYHLSRAVQQRFDSTRVVIDGTGADALFGMFPKAMAARRLYRIPRSLRRTLAASYALRDVWLRPSRLEYLLRICRRSVQMTPPAAAIARNPLRGIAFRISEQQCLAVDNQLESWLDQLDLPEGLEFRLPAIDLILGTANIFAQKNASLFDTRNWRILYPFMDTRIVRRALWNKQWNRANRSPKAVLKSMLAEMVPPGMVYRRKSGFTVPARQYFADPSFVSLLDEALAADRIGAESWAVMPHVRKIRNRLAADLPMPEHMYHFVWTIVFFFLWLTACVETTNPGTERP